MERAAYNHDSSTDLVHDAYSRLTHDQLVLFCSVRSLSTDGSDQELACRLAHFDLHSYKFTTDISIKCNVQPNLRPRWKRSPPSSRSAPSSSNAPTRLPTLPTELMADILDLLGDWELSKAVGLPTSLPRPTEWATASPADEALLTGYAPAIHASDLVRNPPTKLGARAVVRFGYVNVLDMIFKNYRPYFMDWFRVEEDFIPIVASSNSRTNILNWWRRAVEARWVTFPKKRSLRLVIEDACRIGEVASLEWWKSAQSLFPLEYSENALEHASSRNHVNVLEWWKNSGLPLKVGRVMDLASSAGHVEVLQWWQQSQIEFKYDRQAMHHASMHGRVKVLQWWFHSGLQMIFDQDALTLATKHNRPEVLEWWDKSGLPSQYRICDIEEALEDAIGGGEAAREWWKGKGVNFNANDKEWMKLQTLN
ncbi:hypothetical protein SCHPADRAFT_877374 [Schizopora paradoxa]|uniref:Uncharacterized protein n=1 Tax=Schizopora paradoxa TaxID=27342 RepID=A0A0H2RHP0_9AGAM|nr:hypothetical protein SCHPADRAFT_877374 [Schizopora paradoxa]